MHLLGPVGRVGDGWRGRHTAAEAAAPARGRLIVMGVLVAVLMVTGTAAAEPRPIEPAAPVSVAGTDGAVRGEAIAFDADGLTLKSEGAIVIRWADLPAEEVYRLYQQVMDRTDGRQWLELAEILNARDDARTLADTALQVAVLMDESLEAEAQALREARPAAATSASIAPSRIAPEAEPPAEPDRVVWGDLTPTTEQGFIEQEKAFAQDVATTLGVTLNLVETDYFLFYTDLSAKDAYEWQRVLDLMYERVSFLLGIPEGVNVFRGRATVFLFRDRDTFVAFERRFYDRPVTYEAGICHQHNTGEVRIAFYRLEDEKYLKQLMIHEAAHGVVHRYRSPRRVADWINEGIAEWTASAVLNYVQPFKWKKKISADYVRDRGGVIDEAYFTDGQFRGEYYGTALAMTEILLRGGRPRFHDFINAIKDGTPWPVALREVYDMSIDDLVREYRKTIGIHERRR